jgi:tetratricopeptide (TPR) repeat protein
MAGITMRRVDLLEAPTSASFPSWGNTTNTTSRIGGLPKEIDPNEIDSNQIDPDEIPPDEIDPGEIKRRTISRKTAAVLIIVCVLLAIGGCGRNATKGNERGGNTIRKDAPEFSSVPSQPTDTAQTLALAETAYASKDWEAAEQNYVIITRAIPKEATPWFRLGNIYARTNRPDFAVRAYKEALLREPGLSKAWYNMGLVQLRQSANSFLQMRTHTEEQSEAQIRAETMYEATIGLIKEGPKRVRSYPYEQAPSATSPVVTDLPALISAPESEESIQSEDAKNLGGTKAANDMEEAARNRPETPIESILEEQADETQAESLEQTPGEQAGAESAETATPTILPASGSDALEAEDSE